MDEGASCPQPFIACGASEEKVMLYRVLMVPLHCHGWSLKDQLSVYNLV